MEKTDSTTFRLQTQLWDQRFEFQLGYSYGKADIQKIYDADGNYFSNEIITEIKMLEKFYYAEDYHQDYEKNNPDNPYVKQVSIPRLRKFQRLYPELLKKHH